MRKSRTKKEKMKKLSRVLLSFFFAIVLYTIVFLYNREKREVVLPLHVVESATCEFESNVPEQISVFIMGSNSLIYCIDPDKIEAVLDCSYVTEPGIYSVPVKLKYDMGILSVFKVEISAAKTAVRVKFGEKF